MSNEIDLNVRGIEHPLSAAIRGLSEQRKQMFEKRNDLLNNTLWARFKEFWDLYSKEIEDIDRCLDALTKEAR